MFSEKKKDKFLPEFDLSILRLTVQSLFCLFTLYIGYRFYLFFFWATEGGGYVPRPPAVEGFLPISALLGLKRFLHTGSYDLIHPAGLTIFLAALFLSVLLRKGFCGWICPVGFVSNLAEKAGKLWGARHRPPLWIDYSLSPVKYLLLLFFIFIIFIRMDLSSVEIFLRSPFNLAADAKMLNFFLDPSPVAAAILFLLAASSLVLPNPWCRYFCPYGALLGLVAFLGPVQVKRNQEKCIDCKKCEAVCPAALGIPRKKTIRNPDCIGCMECINVCPQENCLTTSVAGKNISPLLIPLGTVGLFLFIWVLARQTGFWESSISPVIFKKSYHLATILLPS